jgi:hypothetical protein
MTRGGSSRSSTLSKPVRPSVSSARRVSSERRAGSLDHAVPLISITTWARRAPSDLLEPTRASTRVCVCLPRLALISQSRTHTRRCHAPAPFRAIRCKGCWSQSVCSPLGQASHTSLRYPRFHFGRRDGVAQRLHRHASSVRRSRMMSDPTPEAASVLRRRCAASTDHRRTVPSRGRKPAGRLWPARPVRTHGAGTRGRLHHDFTGFPVPALFAAFGLPECL